MYKLWLILERDGNAGIPADTRDPDAEPYESRVLISHESINPVRNHYLKHLDFNPHDNADFSTALLWLKAGYKVCRPGWDSTVYFAMIENEIHQIGSRSERRLAYVIEDSILATDWTIYQEEEASV